ncbi:flagellar basal body-associated FliL family protein [Cellulomonas sp. URHB0016]
MPIEQRVISGPKIGAKIGGGGASVPNPTPEPEPTKKGRLKLRVRKRVLVAGGVVLLLAGGAGYWFLGRGGTPVVEAPVPGAVVTVEPVSLNLADGHYLRIGFGLQLTEDTLEAPDTARALDIAIALYSGRTVAEISDPATRAALKTELVKQLTEQYDGEVMDVYLTNFVTQ